MDKMGRWIGAEWTISTTGTNQYAPYSAISF